MTEMYTDQHAGSQATGKGALVRSSPLPLSVIYHGAQRGDSLAVNSILTAYVPCGPD